MDLQIFKFSKPLKTSKPILDCVYAFEMSNNTIKIGITRNVKKRIESIKASSGLSIINFYHTEFAPHNFMLSVERACQKKFKVNQTQGEFFNITFAEACTELDKYNDKILTILKQADEKYCEELEYFWELEDDYFNAQEKSETLPKNETQIAVQNQQMLKSTIAAIALKDAASIKKTMEENFGVKPGIAGATVISMVERLNGVELTEIKNLLPAAEHEIGLYTPTQIAKKFGLKSAQVVNKILLEKGLQEKNGNSYILTEKGKEYGEAMPFNNDTSGHSGYQIKWSAAVFSFFEELVAA